MVLYSVGLSRPKEAFGENDRDGYWNSRKNIYVLSDSLDTASNAAVTKCNAIEGVNDYFTTDVSILAGEDVGEGAILINA
jgi:hypothetical protein